MKQSKDYKDNLEQTKLRLSKMNVLETDAIFNSKGFLIQIGDIVNTKTEWLNCSGGGFENDYNSGIVEKIYVTSDVMVNSSYLNAGLSYSTNTRNHYCLINGELYASYEVSLSFGYDKKSEYLNSYFNLELNSQKKEYLISFIENVLNLEIKPKQTNRLGSFLYKYNRDLYNYYCTCFWIRMGQYGKLNADNYVNITLQTLSKLFGIINRTDNIVHKITTYYSTFAKGKYFYYGKKNIGIKTLNN